jgi:CP family cyanate transporter-like MFS transporter
MDELIPRRRPLWLSRMLPLIGVALVAINLRPALVALSPIYAQIGADIPLGNLEAGLLGTLPPLSFAIFGLITPLIVRRLSLEAALILALSLMLVSQMLRGAALDYPALVVTSIGIFAGIGIANVVLPPLIKRNFPDRVGFLTSLYVTLMTLAFLLPPLVSVLAAEAIGWRITVSMWSLFALAALVPWTILWIRGARTADGASSQAGSSNTRSRPWRSTLGWASALLFGMTAMNVYALAAWLPRLLSETADLDPAESGAYLSLYLLLSIPPALLVPTLAVRYRNGVGAIVAAGTASYLLGYGGLFLLPAHFTWLWVTLAGLGPLLFPLSIVLINLRTRTAHGVIALTGFTFGVGYLLGALGPVVVGLLRESTGGWAGPLVMLLATVAVTVISGLVLARPRMLEDDRASSREDPIGH